MTAKPIEKTEPIEDRNALLEKTLIKEYLQTKGYLLEDVQGLPKDVADKLMKEALQYASLKLEEVQARAHFIKELHGSTSSFEK